MCHRAPSRDAQKLRTLHDAAINGTRARPSRNCRLPVTQCAALMPTSTEVTALFAVPFMRAREALPAALVSGLVTHFCALVEHENSSSPNLSHTSMLKPSDSPLLVDAATHLSPLLGDFGALMFG